MLKVLICLVETGIIGKKDELKKLADAHNIISKYLKMQ